MFIYFFSDRVLFCSMISKKNKNKTGYYHYWARFYGLTYDLLQSSNDLTRLTWNLVVTWLDLLDFFFFSSHSNLGVAWDLLARLWYFGFFVSIKQKQTYQKQIYAVVSAQSVIFSVSCSTWEQTSSGCDSKQLEGNFGSSKSK